MRGGGKGKERIQGLKGWKHTTYVHVKTA
jgi:hypothetical protein